MSGSTQTVVETPASHGAAGAAPTDSAAPHTRLLVERVTAARLATHRDAWADLCRRALEPNVFLDPAFMLALLQHGSSHRRLGFLLVWEDCGPAAFGRLLGLFPIKLPRQPIAPVARGFAHEQTSSGTPLVDRAQADVVLRAALSWLDGPSARSAALTLHDIAADGAFFTALHAVCRGTDRRLAVLEARERAVLLGPEDTGGRVASFASAKRRKERARQLRRLSETGTRIYTSAKASSDIATAMERFLALEHRGWKGTRRTALLADPARATFARTVTRLMAQDGRCRIDAIEVDGQPVAMGIILADAGRAYFWKTTFDEAYAAYSPGVQLALELTRTQLADVGIAMTDSCAVANHPMIDRLWPDRAAIADVMVAIRPGQDQRFARCVHLEQARRGLRRRAKAAWRTVRG